MSLKYDIRQTFSDCRRPLKLIVCLIPLLYLLSGFYLIGAEQRGIVIRLGKVSNDQVLPGLHYRLPWPIDQVTILGVTELRSMIIDFSRENQAAYLQTEVTTLSGDLVNLRIDIQYTIDNTGDFYFSSAEPERLLKQVAKVETINYLLTQPFEPLLTTGRAQAQHILRDKLEKGITELDIGIAVNSVTIQRLDPARSAQRAFDRAQSAPAQKQQLLEEAKAQRNTQLVAARSLVHQLSQHYAASSEEILLAAEGDKDKLESIISGLKLAPNVNIERYYRENLESILSQAKLTVVDSTNN
ncbi:hypothetical protein BCU68_16200 [Vibrio sp. 10N.286.49.B3]|uniref:protease modulator HflK n=1 Tax=Vibrio sp. 10N.286.49.B3 TaxID=1880855 RepID=UPI000C85C479|nr:protease modulator HflK [Vibrio sp. 10N.286.49.B3]PMH40600.1 hypothetical protein BCU68_16200 [Vibrio sp. 10N.286.49.B3]